MAVLPLDPPDPLSLATAPPRDESPADRWAREQREAQGRLISEQIDAQIKAEKLAMKKRGKPIKILLLGQSESGKSTTVKNFQLAYAYSSFLQERSAWRAVIHLNLVRSVNTILDSSEATLMPDLDLDADDEDEDDEDDASASAASTSSTLTDRHRALQLRLAPLRHVQRDLERSLGAATSDAPEYAGDAAPWARLEGGRGAREAFVTSRYGWKTALRRGDEAMSDGECEPQAQNAAEVIASCAEDMIALWTDSGVQAVLSRRKVKSRLEEGPGFLNDVARVAKRDYEPSDEDVVRARLRTMGVQEYRFKFERGPDAGRDWLLYDVGGARSSRHAWAPYFDDINAIIFLAPISCFDERLAEDRRVNRLQDSLLLWKAVCSSKLLRNVQLILFLNKCDLLQKKISRGVRVANSVPSYGDRPNDARSVAKYFRHQFKEVLVRQSPEKRTFYAYFTSVVDTKATAITVAAGMCSNSGLLSHVGVSCRLGQFVMGFSVAT
ncbi:G-alpha-domain-containing protein [Wolfiporia cocos MD-104 SS10]|uniref:G-alpha-domain-containing protein n=1 Tax=Wolfiporia cocos (strain MD-104) TaxID=742152 RepID=A0A2H3JR25_WOLCO|nr:G-alpha-domain-containing protein [Wolfiporia cocos MD-104 SS10]